MLSCIGEGEPVFNYATQRFERTLLLFLLYMRHRAL